VGLDHHTTEFLEVLLVAMPPHPAHHPVQNVGDLHPVALRVILGMESKHTWLPAGRQKSCPPRFESPALDDPADLDDEIARLFEVLGS
jgi:hypothetical protein